MIRLSIRRPVAVAMAYLAVALLGVAAWRNIPIELLPDTRLPRLSIQAEWPGASPETVEAFLTSPIEATAQQVKGVEKVTSRSLEMQGWGFSVVDIEFSRGTDMEFARLDLSERIATLEDDLPPGVQQVLVQPYVPEEFSTQDQAFLRYTFTGPHTLGALREYLEDEVVPELNQIRGVAVVNLQGGRDRLIEIELDPERIDALGLAPAEVSARVQDLDLVREAGVVRRGAQEWTVTIRNRPGSAAEIRTAVVLADGGRLVRVSDVATVRDTFEDPRGHYRIDGQPAVAFDVTKEIGANTVRVADEVKARVARLEGAGPVNTRYIVNYDESKEIRRQLSDLRLRAGFSAVVIVAVLLLFLGSVRSTAMVFATVAFSVLISLNLIYFAGFTLNLLTLMGLAMGFGLIVDNSIVVLENVFRKWQDGASPSEASHAGARQVVLPILASTATTLIVFVPFVYLQGELRVYYVPLAIVVGLTLLASLFVAFSFIPAFASRALVRRKRSAFGSAFRDPSQGGSPPLYARFYSALLAFILAYPWVVVVSTVSVLGGSYYLFDRYVTRGALWGSGGWGEDTYLRIQYSLPRGSDLDRMDQLVVYFEDRLTDMPEVREFTSRVQPQFGITEVFFPDSLEQTYIPVAVKEQLTSFGLGFSGAEVRVYGFGPSFYGGGGSPPNYSIQVLGYNYERVRDIAEDLGRRLERQPRIQEVDTNATGRFFNQDRASEFVVDIDRERLARYDISVRDFVARLSAAVQGTVGDQRIKVGGEEIRFEVKLEGNRELDVRALREVMIEGPAGDGIRLDDVVTIRPREVLAEIRRENQQYQRTVAYEFRGPRKLGDLVHDRMIEGTEVPPGYTVKKADTWRWDDDERSQIFLVFLVSVGLIYMVTAALFESLKQPLCVLLTVPMALIGVFLIFFYSEATFTREAYVGVIMMGGIVVNNAILVVDQINRLRREEGRELRDAIVLGTLQRVRPILMTTATTVLGLLPLVLFSEAVDSNIWNALAYTLVGGLLSSTVFVLSTTPALYYLFERPSSPHPASVPAPDLATLQAGG